MTISEVPIILNSTSLGFSLNSSRNFCNGSFEALSSVILTGTNTTLS